ncbi:MAG: PAS domain-containing protein [Ignavibacteriae bacterium]|nr:PAS domain-containing protein [Ignavibacteriota bacterium]
MTNTPNGAQQSTPGPSNPSVRFSSITPIITFVILVIGIILASLLIYQQEQRAMLRETEDRLSAVSRLQATRLSVWRRERLTDASVLASERTLGRAAAELVRHPGDRERLESIRHALDVMKRGYGYYSVQLLDDSARVWAHASGDRPVVGLRMPLLLRDVRDHGKPLFTDFHSDSARVPVTHLDVLAPLDLTGINDIPPLYLLLRVDPTAFLFPFLEAVDSSRTTPVCEFVRSDDNSVVAFSAASDAEHQGGWQAFPADRVVLPEVRAARGERGFFMATDHHGRRVYAYATDVADMPWSVIALLPEDVIRNPLRVRAETMGFFITLFTLASAFAILFLWRRDLKASRRRETESRVLLVESRDLYRQLYEGMYQGVIYVDDSGDVIDANPSAIRILRLPATTAKRFSLRGVFHAVVHEDGTPVPPDQMPSVVVAHTRRPVMDLTFGVQRTEGSPIIWLIGSAFPLMHEGEVQPGHTLMVFEDITDRRAVIERLRESESLNRNLVEHLPVRIFIKDRDSRYRSCNAAFAHDLGILPDEIVGRSDLDLFPRQLAEEYQAGDRIVFEENRAIDVQEEYQLPGRSRWIRVIKVPYRDPHGNVTGLLGMFEDITDRRLAEEIRSSRLRLTDFARDHTTEELLRETLDEVGTLTGSPIGFYHFLEPDQKTLTLQTWSTRTLKEFCHAEGKGTHYALDEAGVWIDCVRERRPVIHNDYMALPHRKGLPPGHAHVQRELAVPIFRGNLIVAILGIGNKATDYTQQDIDTVVQFADMAWDVAEVKRAEDRLKSSLREKEVLLKEVHHRVKNNLQVISSLLNLQSARIADPTIRAAFFASQTRVRSMALIHEKLYRSEMLAGIDFGDYLRTVTNDLVRSYSITTVTVDMETDEVHLPVDTAIPCGLIVNELISNALKHAFPAGAEGKLYVKARRLSSAEVELIVEDTGCGMPPGTDPRSLTSMGMTLVMSLTEQIGGTFSLTVPHGTRIAIRFPG